MLGLLLVATLVHLAHLAVTKAKTLQISLLLRRAMRCGVANVQILERPTGTPVVATKHFFHFAV